MNPGTVTTRSSRIGLAAIVVVWITGPITVPFIKVLRPNFSAEEILFVRSAFGLICSMLIGGSFWKCDRNIKIAGIVIGSSSIAFYRAIQVWDVNPVMVIISFIPMVNITVAIIEGRKISPIVWVSLILLIGGIICALDPWSRPMNMLGFVWAMICVVVGGIGYEMWGRSPDDGEISEKYFWLSAPLFVASAIIVASCQGPMHWEKYAALSNLKLLLFVGIINGIVFMYANIVPFSKAGRMNTVAAIVLMQGLTPATIIGACVLIHESMSFRQWSGVACAIVGATILSVWVARKPKPLSQ